MKRVWRWVGVVLVLLLLIAAMAAFWLLRERAGRLVYPVRSRPLQTPADYDLSGEDVTFTTDDGLTLSGWYIPPTTAANGGALVFIHGLNSNRGMLLDQAAMLAGHGYGALLFDLRAHGQSEGEQTTWGVAEIGDVQAAVRFLAERPDVDATRIGLVGHSMGGAIAIQTAAVTPAVQLVIAESAYASFASNAPTLTVSFARLHDDLAPLVLWQAGRIAGVRPQHIQPLDDVAGLAPRPVLFIHGEADKTVDVSNSQRLYQRAGEPKALYLVPGAGHDNFMRVDPAGFEEQVVGFLEAYFLEVD